jgi:hypothetical protein
MNTRLTLVGLALLMAIVPAGAEDEGIPLKDYTDGLLETYGPDATVTNGIVEGKTKGGEDFSDLHPKMSLDSATVVNCGVPWTGAACPGTGTSANRYCRNPQNIGGVAYEVQHDRYFTVNGHLYRASRLLDCQATCTPGQLPGTTFGQLCP